MQQTFTEASAKLRNDARESSRLAALRAAPQAGTARLRVLEAVVSAGARGITDDELSAVLTLSPNSVRPRRLELVEGGWVVDSGMKRDSFYGNPAICWRATAAAALVVKKP
jgi:hypothetical protein